ncbi:MAG: MFS transporter, partial [Candidatus Krumholzibacteriia bacterium]
NWLIGWTNDQAGASAANPGGYAPGMWIFSGLGFLALFFAFMLMRAERGPGGHGLDTIKA